VTSKPAASTSIRSCRGWSAADDRDQHAQDGETGATDEHVECRQSTRQPAPGHRIVGVEDGSQDDGGQTADQEQSREQARHHQRQNHDQQETEHSPTSEEPTGPIRARRRLGLLEGGVDGPQRLGNDGVLVGRLRFLRLGGRLGSDLSSRLMEGTIRRMTRRGGSVLRSSPLRGLDYRDRFLEAEDVGDIEDELLPFHTNSIATGDPLEIEIGYGPITNLLVCGADDQTPTLNLESGPQRLGVSADLQCCVEATHR